MEIFFSGASGAANCSRWSDLAEFRTPSSSHCHIPVYSKFIFLKVHGERGKTRSVIHSSLYFYEAETEHQNEASIDYLHSRVSKTFRP